MLDTENGGIILLRQVAFYQLKQCYILEDLIGNFKFSLSFHFTPL